jgi:RNA polymerase sigma-70 factor (ECF subfamily)
MTTTELRTSVADAALWARVRGGDGDAYAELYRRHSDAVLTHCFRRTAAWDSAEDATSMVFLETWRLRERVVVADSGSLLPWLLGVANNVIHRHRRSRARHRRALERLHHLTERAGVPDHADFVAQRLADEGRMRLVGDALGRLSRTEQEAFTLCVWAELSYAEAAVAMNVPIGTVRSRLSRARARLRAHITDADLQFPSSDAKEYPHA